jgi:hypothetical protein
MPTLASQNEAVIQLKALLHKALRQKYMPTKVAGCVGENSSFFSWPIIAFELR